MKQWFRNGFLTALVFVFVLRLLHTAALASFTDLISITPGDSVSFNNSGRNTIRSALPPKRTIPP